MAVTTFHPSERDLRCDCGSLLARLTARGIELKCRRCKRRVLVVVREAQQRWVAVTLHAGGP